MSLNVLSQGFALSLGLIVAIGAQNAFVLRQGLRREYIGAVVFFCAAIDALLISAGVLGMAALLGENALLRDALALIGALFLSVYGWQALQRARQNESLHAADGEAKKSLTLILAQAAAFTLLNPHVYLDTVLLIGSIGAQHTAELQVWFIAGASLASMLWFVSLGYGARFLAPIFAKPKAWQVLDVVIALVMWAIAISLLNMLCG
jgi:L-lysine exporter family protein LysE/ArgO